MYVLTLVLNNVMTGPPSGVSGESSAIKHPQQYPRRFVDEVLAWMIGTISSQPWGSNFPGLELNVYRILEVEKTQCKTDSTKFLCEF